MRHPKPEKTVEGRCPNCGKSRIEIVLEGSSKFIMLSGPGLYCTTRMGRCCGCHFYLETNFTDDDIIAELEWDFVDKEKVEFLLGSPLPTRPSPRNDPLWDSELDC
jgi:hypothetical protein